MKKIMLTLFLLVFFLQLIAQDYETGKLLLYVKDPSAIPELVKDGDNVKISCKVEQIQDLFNLYEVTYFERAFPSIDLFSSTEKYDLDRVYLIIFNGNENSLKEIIDKEYDKYYDYSEYVPHYNLVFTPNDYGAPGSNYALDIINAQDAWNITKGSPNTIIGIVDKGFQSHDDLNNKIVSLINNECPTTHGTFVAGIAGAQTDNNMGIASIGFNCMLSLDGGYDPFVPMNNLIAIAAQGIKVVNASWGSCGYSRADQDASNFINDNGTLLIAGAGNGKNLNGDCGNGGCGPDCNGYLYPASYDRVLSVTSVGSNLSHISNFDGAIHTHNDKVDVCAPGYNVLSTADGTYYNSNGTSFATPYVSGLAGLIFSINPQFTPEIVHHIIKTTTLNIDAINPQYVGLIGTGLIDAYKAVLKAQEIFNLTAMNYYVYNGQNLLWDNVSKKRVDQFIHIYSGGTLTIRGEVYLNPNSVIVIEPGGKLYVDGGFLTSYTPIPWKGIEVMGNSSLAQELNNQGYLKIYNHSYISNASLAVLVGARYSGAIVNTCGGGIIELENSTLINSKQTVYFTPYTRGTPPLSLFNKSYIRNCDLIWDKALDSRLVFITLNGVQIGDISGNRLENRTNTFPTMTPNHGIGILSNYSSFQVKSNGSIQSKFYNLYYGIQSNATNSSQAFSVSNAEFSRAFYGIYASGSNNLDITGNIFYMFNYNDIGIPYPISYGLYMNNCSRYLITNNTFRNFGNPSQIRQIIGILVNNCKHPIKPIL